MDTIMTRMRAARSLFATGLTSIVAAFAVAPLTAQAQLNVLTVDCTPFVSPGPSVTFGPTNTMGMSVQQVDMGGQFNVMEITPAAFRAKTAAQLATYDVIAINNNPSRIDCGAGLGLGTTWHSVIGVQSGGRVVLTSHDAARFKIIIQPGAAFFGTGAPGPGVEPFGADDLVRNTVIWAGSGNRTGLVIFNDSARFSSVGGQGWNNPELNLPMAWNITDSDQTGGNICDGGYTDILPAFATHQIYQGLSDARFGVNSVSSFAANVGDGSFHSIFGSFNQTIFKPTEVVINSGQLDIGGFNNMFGIGAFCSPFGPDGTAITLIRDEILQVAVDIKPQSCRNPLNTGSLGVLPVAVLGTDSFDVTQIDPTTVRLAGVAPLRWSVEDVATPFEPFTGKEDAFDCTDEGADGFDDLTFKFNQQEVVNALEVNFGPLTDGQVVVVPLTGNLQDNTAFEGEDVVVILNK